MLSVFGMSNMRSCVLKYFWLLSSLSVTLPNAQAEMDVLCRAPQYINRLPSILVSVGAVTAGTMVSYLLSVRVTLNLTVTFNHISAFLRVSRGRSREITSTECIHSHSFHNHHPNHQQHILRHCLCPHCHQYSHHQLPLLVDVQL